VSRELTVIVYLALAVVAAGMELAARLTGRFTTLGNAVGAANRSRAGRWLLIAAWIWVGWHFFVRAQWS